MQRQILRALIVAAITSVSVAHASDSLHFYVSTTGRDSWSGRLADPKSDGTDGPFATLERARDAIRELRGKLGELPREITVELRGGEYFRDATFTLTAHDGGSDQMPITYTTYKREPARLIGGKPVTNFVPVTDAATLDRLCPEARGKVLQADLKAAGISDFGKLVSRGFGRPSAPAAAELYFDGKPMQVARWPNEGWLKIAAVPDNKPDGGKFNYDGDRPARWTHANDIWIHGYWTYDWAETYEKVKSIDQATKTIATEPPHGIYGYKAGARYYALNLIEEIDQPGEYAIDRQAGVLYFWPPKAIDAAQAYVSTTDNMISAIDASYVAFEGLTVEIARGSGIIIRNGTHDRVAGCTLRNLGNVAVNVTGGTECSVVGCDLYNLSESGISIEGGDRKTLTPGGHAATNNHIHDYSLVCSTYQPAIHVQGVGNIVDHNLIHDAPHMAILLHGNEHVIEFNEVHHVCTDTDDAGAFYMGRDWTERGNIVRHNYFHHVGKMKGSVGVQSVYLDDWASGTKVYGNVVYKGSRGVLLGGGRNNAIENNIFIDCTPAVHVDSRGLGWAKNYFNGGTDTLTERLDAMNYKQPPYSTRYPELLTLYQDEPALAKYNVVARNICTGGKWLQFLDGLTDKVVRVEDNLVDTDPKFVDAAKGDFRLQDDSPAYKLGFKPIPFDKIGLMAAEVRASPPPAR
jgi:parallel beta-helix repeat protein